MWVSLIHIVCGSCFLLLVDSANILGVFASSSYSHQTVFQAIWKELSLRGHRVTVYTPRPLKDPTLTNLTEFDIGGFNRSKSDLRQIMKTRVNYIEEYERNTLAQLNHPNIKDLIENTENRSYDVLLVEYLGPLFFAFKEVYKVPMVGILSMSPPIKLSDLLGMVKHPVVEPSTAVQSSQAYTFRQRLQSWFYSWMERIAFDAYIFPLVDRQLQKYFGNKVNKSAHQLCQEVELVLGNYNAAIEPAKPMPPNFIPISGIHIHKPTSLPEVKEFPV